MDFDGLKTYADLSWGETLHYGAKSLSETFGTSATHFKSTKASVDGLKFYQYRFCKNPLNSYITPILNKSRNWLSVNIVGKCYSDAMRFLTSVTDIWRDPKAEKIVPIMRDITGEYIGDISNLAMLIFPTMGVLNYAMYASSLAYSSYNLMDASNYLFSEKEKEKDRAKAFDRGYENNNHEIYVREKSRYHLLNSCKAVASIVSTALGFGLFFKNWGKIARYIPLSNRKIMWIAQHAKLGKIYSATIASMLSMSAIFYKALQTQAFDKQIEKMDNSLA